jgi:DNA modification methylase
MAPHPLCPKLDALGLPWWATESGDVLLVQGDCLEVLPLVEAGSVDMIWTDPPYGHGNLDGDLQSSRVRDGVKGARTKAPEPILNDFGVQFDATLIGFLDCAARVLNRDCCCCCCCGGGGPMPTFARVSQWMDERLDFFHAVVWDKSARGNGMGWRYRRNYEFVMVAHRKGGKLLWANDAQAVPNVVRHMPVIDREHPNEKPVEMIADFIEWHTKPGMLVVDPFMGSASTAAACLRTGRRFIGIEKEAKYYAIACDRIRRELERTALLEPVPRVVQSELFQ